MGSSSVDVSALTMAVSEIRALKMARRVFGENN